MWLLLGTSTHGLCHTRAACGVRKRVVLAHSSSAYLVIPETHLLKKKTVNFQSSQSISILAQEGSPPANSERAEIRIDP
ncbi:hypothetical protein KSP40_PGU007361 [Platanthera guangdongensis]|uniref:Secreted protein n=1 Tax=Platanthera guangdongensis TaxID=2320717 RepID=A0ABR2LI19_9ASPA